MADIKGKVIRIFDRLVDAIEKDPSIQKDMLEMTQELLGLVQSSGIRIGNAIDLDAFSIGERTLIQRNVRYLSEYMRTAIFNYSTMELVVGITDNSPGNILRNRIADELCTQYLTTGVGILINDELWVKLTQALEDPLSKYANLIRHDLLTRALKLRRERMR
jgi:hypothetical protein